jgi:hypothetical protein
VPLTEAEAPDLEVLHAGCTYLSLFRNPYVTWSFDYLLLYELEISHTERTSTT